VGVHAFHEYEIDVLVIQGTKVVLAIECKSGSADMKPATIRCFKERFPDVRLIVASMVDDRRRIAGNVEVFPWKEAIELYRGI
jgi:hypothetical protein